MFRFPRYYGIIYRAENTVNGKSYIGKTTGTLDSRKNRHEKDSLKRKRRSSAFHNALRKYGADAFEWSRLDFGDSRKDLNSKECRWIKKLDCLAPNGYNLTRGGDGASVGNKLALGSRGPWFGKKRSAGTRAKISKSLRGKPSWNKGKKLSEEHRENLSKSHLGKKAWNAGLKMSKKFCKAVSKGHLGIKPTDEARANMSVSGKKRWSRERRRQRNA